MTEPCIPRTDQSHGLSQREQRRNLGGGARARKSCHKSEPDAEFGSTGMRMPAGFKPMKSGA
jgi:hypothetical protein